jgi:signal peptidase
MLSRAPERKRIGRCATGSRSVRAQRAGSGNESADAGVRGYGSIALTAGSSLAERPEDPPNWHSSWTKDHGVAKVPAPVKKWVRALPLVVLVLAFALFLAVAVVPRMFGVELRSVASGSMKPSISEGALVVAFHVSADDVAAGDVIMFHQPDEPSRVITHRVVGFAGQGADWAVQTKGDANDTPDPWLVKPEHLMGRVRFALPAVGSTVEALHSQLGLLLLLAISAMLLLVATLPPLLRAAQLGGDAPAPRPDARMGELPSQAAAPPLPRFMRVGPAPAAPPVAEADTAPASPKRARRRRSGTSSALVIRLPWIFLSGLGVASIAMAAVAAFSYATAPRPSRQPQQQRLDREIESISALSAKLARSEALSGDTQVAQYVTDPALRNAQASEAERLGALRQAILQDTNTLSALAVIDLNGKVITSTDASITDVHDSQAFLVTRASDRISSSDAVLFDGRHGYIDYAAPVRTASGTTWAVLLGRADPMRVFANTLSASVDDSTNLILTGDDRLVGGVTDSLLGTPWHAQQASAGAVRASIDGNDVLCQMTSIGAGTDVDHKLQVASCLPISLAALTAGPDYGRYGLYVIGFTAAATLAAAIALWIFARQPAAASPAGALASEPVTAANEEPPA